MEGFLRPGEWRGERATGFEPAVSAWKADALPLGDARKVPGGPGYSVGVGGLEPPTPASQTRCATNCATPRQVEYNAQLAFTSRKSCVTKPIENF